MVGNSIGHAIDTKPVRKAAGKPENGTIKLKFYQVEDNLVFECEDDGNGLDLEKLNPKR